MRVRRLLIGVGVVAVVGVGALYAYIQSIDPEQYRHRIAAAVSAATGRTVVIEGPMTVEKSLVPVISVENVVVLNAEGFSQPWLARAKRIEARLALIPLLSKKVEVERIELVQPELFLETDGKGRRNWQSADAAAATAPQDGGAPPDLKVNRIEISDAAITIKDAAAGHISKIVIERLAAEAATGSDPIRLEAKGTALDKPLSLEGEVGSWRQITGVDSDPFKVAVKLVAAGSRLSAKGQIDRLAALSGIDLALSFESEDPAALGPFLDLDIPALAPTRLTARLRDESGGWSVGDVAATVGRSDIGGTVSLNLAGQRPMFGARLASKLIVLDDFENRGKPQPKAKRGDGRVIPEVKLPTGTLRDFDAELDWTIERAELGGPLTQVQAKARLREGRLEIKPLSAQLPGGTASAELTLDAKAKPAVLAATLSGDKLLMGALLQEWAGLGGVSGGPATIRIELKGAGDSLRAVLARSQGGMSLVMGKAVIENRYADLLALDVLREIAPWTPKDRVTNVQCMVARFNVAGGVATARQLLFDTDAMTLGGKGRINLGTEAIDLTLVPRPKEASLINLATAVDVGGTLSNPKLSPNAADVAKTVAGAVVGAAVAPLGILIPMVSTGTDDANPCVTALGQSGRKTNQPSKKKDGGIEGFFKDLFE